MAMAVSGGSRRGARNSAIETEPHSAGVLNNAQKFVDPVESGKVRHPQKPEKDPHFRREEWECTAPSGVWLGAADGLVLFHPVPADGEGPQGCSALESSSEEEADEATLDAACWLMPLLPRELIAEFLQLGPYRDGGTA